MQYFHDELDTRLAALAPRFALINRSLPECPVHLSAAFPVGTDQPGGRFLPPAARVESGRLASGRGLTPKQARTSTLGEAAQLVSTCRWGDEKTVRARADELSGEVVLPNDLMQFSERQIGRLQADHRQTGYTDGWLVPFDQQEPIDWVQALSLQDSAPAWIPAAYAYIGGSDLAGGLFCLSDSNGTAAGQSLESAIIAAFLELVERDATGIWWYGCHRKPGLDWKRFDLPIGLRAWLDVRERTTHLIDLTTDLEIPVCAAISCDSGGKAVAMGFSADFQPIDAVVSAITEMCQMEANLTLIDAIKTQLAPATKRNWPLSISLENMPHLRSTNSPPSRCWDNSPAPADLTQLLQFAATKGKIFVLNMTRAELGIPVVRVLIPGLCHYKARFGAKRLFSVPRSLGWKNKPVIEQDLNQLELLI